MSEFEIHTGELILLKDKVETFEEAVEFLNSNGHLTPEQYDEVVDNEELGVEDTGFFWSPITKSLYRLSCHQELHKQEGLFYHKKEEGHFGFVARFYNGGACLSEVLEDSFKG